ncbi:MAG: methyltransferase domain-containing protein [Actinophytocola sp.]|uniref:class I SAM-dependent DNA methyltransferase n=1 Tax=Actinophytocola sp. TaxID=1872138 RepID=UPI00132B9ED0|nr:class I SAM-dependent methyltransferase [Actinophytocola sp.]MPZ80029.1 methyltransferase domain-containing protein [Actinophytocola sp.]
MAEFDPRLYGARWAERYDEWHAGMMDDDGAVAALSELAGDGPLLEFGVGTGRLAVPLAEKGHDVVGVDVSEDMLAQLAGKSDAVTTVVGDMTTVRVGREFDVAFIAFNSIFVLATQDDQVRLFRNAAAHLRPGGRFVLETAFVHGVGVADSHKLRVASVESDQLTLSAGIIDPVTQFYNGTWVELTPEGTRFYPIHGRNVTHHEMDLMAQLAGMELEHRWGDWKRGPFTAESKLHVSVYRKPSQTG